MMTDGMVVPLFSPRRTFRCSASRRKILIGIGPSFTAVKVVPEVGRNGRQGRPEQMADKQADTRVDG
jgi:hypothetical protein